MIIKGMITEDNFMRALLFSAVLLSACASPPVVDPVSNVSQASDEVRDDTRYLRSGDFASPAWVNEAFTGTHFRRLTGNALDFSVEQTVEGGGWDTAVGPSQEPGIPVSTVAHDATICFAYTLDLDASEGGKWWAGPKISVNWAAMTDAPSTGEWYENYVVEVANQTPAELEADLFAYFDAESLGESLIDGATYRHVRLRYEQWWQYWSIRQDYRMDGAVRMGPILDAWAGIPQDLIFDGVKANIETHGIVRGEGRIIATPPAAPDGSVDVLRRINC